MKKIALAGILLSALAAPAFASDFYAVGSIGGSHFDVSKGDIDNLLTSSGFSGFNSSLKQNGFGYKAQLGYQVNKYFAVEGGYVDLGEAKYSVSGPGLGGDIKLKASGANIAALGIYPIDDTFSVFGKLGVIDAKAKIEGNGVSDSTTKARLNFGVGASYAFAKDLSLRAEIEQFNKLGDENTTGKKINVNLYSVGVAYRF